MKASARRRQKTNNRKKKPNLFYGLIIILAIVIAGVLIFNTIFEVKKITVEGTTIYEKSKIEATSGIAFGQNYFFLDKEKAIEQIETTYSYLENTKIHYRPFSTAVIEVTEAKNTYALPVGDQFALLSENFKVLDFPVTVLPSGLIRLQGVTFDPPMVGTTLVFSGDNGSMEENAIEQIVSAMKENDLQEIGMIDVSDLLSIRMEYGGRAVIQFGRRIKADKKAKNIKYLLTHEFVGNQCVWMDASYLEGSEDARIYANAINSINDYYEAKKALEERLSQSSSLENSSSHSGESGVSFGSSSGASVLGKGAKTSSGKGTSSQSAAASKSGSPSETSRSSSRYEEVSSVPFSQSSSQPANWEEVPSAN